VAPGVARTLDAFVTKTVTPLPREGNPPPRIAETESGMLNSIGLQNPGIDRFLAVNFPRLAELGVPIWVSVGGFSAADYAETCMQLDHQVAVATIELNLSCPNVEEAPETAAELVAAAREWVVDGTRQGEHLATGHPGQPGGDQRPRFPGRLDHQGAVRQAGDDPVALGKVFP